MPAGSAGSQPSESGTASRSEVGDAGIQGVRWVGAARLVAEVAGLGVAAVLARLVPPDEFGLFAVATIASLVAVTLAGDGVTAAIVRSPEFGPRHSRAASVLAVGGGLFAGLLVFGFAVVTSGWLGDDLARLLQIGSACFPVAAMAAVSRGILQRRLAFRRLAIADLAATAATLGTSVGLALSGLDAEALILGVVAGQVVAALVLLASAPPRWALPAGEDARLVRAPELRELLAFGVPNAGAGIASTLSQNVDYAVIAGRADAATVGFYWRGYQLGVESQRKLSGVVSALGLPLYARLEEHSDRLALRSKIVRLQTMLIAPLLVILILAAPILVPFVFGGRWEPAVLPTQILAGAGLISAAQTGVGPLIAAMGHPGAMLRWNIGNIFVLGAGVYLAAPHGLVVLSVTVLALRAARFAVSYELLLRRIAGVPRAMLAMDLAPATVSGLVAGGAGTLVHLLLGPGVADAVEVGLICVTVALVYLASLKLAFPVRFDELLAVLRRLVPVARFSRT